MADSPTQKADARNRLASQIAGLYVRGYSPDQISRRLGCNPAEVKRCLSIARKHWRKRATKAYDDLLAHEVAKLDEVERAAWDGWDRSLREEVQAVSEESEGPKGPTVKTGTRRTTKAGSPAFLATITATVKQRCELLGLTKGEADNAADDAPEVVELVIDTREEAEEFRAISMGDYRKALAE